MKLRHTFVLFFSGYVLMVCLIIAGIALFYLHSSYATFAHAPNPALIAVMADRMFLKAVFGFSAISVLAIGLSIVVGILISRLISGSYLAFFRDVTAIARSRIASTDKSAFSNNERTLLQSYLAALLEDQERLRDFEKVKSWKEGARLLMHEIKNPLTPLKLAAQSLTLQEVDAFQARQNIQRILVATADVENILVCFKELVNIEFGPKENFMLSEFLRESFDQQKTAEMRFDVTGLQALDPDAVACGQRALLRMLLNNLIINGIEAGCGTVCVDIAPAAAKVSMTVTTPGGRIENIPQIFRLGYSQKGKGRGLGLFLCKMISDYLDLNLTCRNIERGVVFSIEITILSGVSHAAHLPG
jgi:signal transduction histidine kinase